MIATEDEVYRQVQRIVADELAVDEGDVVPDARLTADLGAESIDYLAIQFRIEQVFGFKIEPNAMLMGEMPPEQFVQDGKITDVGMAELRRRLPHVCLDVLEQSRDVRDFRSVFTVDALVRFVSAKLDGSNRALSARSD